jgi:hypothetical protein
LLLQYHIIRQAEGPLCPPTSFVVFAAILAMSSKTSCISSPVIAEHSA